MGFTVEELIKMSKDESVWVRKVAVNDEHILGFMQHHQIFRNGTHQRAYQQKIAIMRLYQMEIIVLILTNFCAIVQLYYLQEVLL